MQWLFAIPNGLLASRRLHARTALEQGLTPVGRGFVGAARGYHGLLIELKRRDATPCRLSANQKGFIEFQRAQGYRAEWCKGWDAARNLVLTSSPP
ncbi:MAG: hypothetical protein IPN66_09370 [Candidatus Competibacteraceae bacterium]|nr:hypothetical protein [Candidatus Competibacteraceae bacterium]